MTRALAVVVLCAGCTGTGDVDDGVVLTRHDATAVEGTFRHVSFAAVELTPRLVEVGFRVDGVEARFHVDHARGEGHLDPVAAGLTAGQLQSLAALVGPLSEVLPTDPERRSLVEDTLMRETSFLAVAPAETPLPELSFVSDNGWVHLSCGCSRQYIGSGYYRTAGKGGSCGGGRGCKGRCGVGCGPDNLKWPWSWGSGVYTRDCAKHDYGLGSWGAAADDYSFARYNCG